MMYEIVIHNGCYAVMSFGIIVFLANTWLEAESYVNELGGEG